MFQNLPSFYDYGNANITPSVLNTSGTPLSRFFQRYLLQKAFSVFEWELPKTWSKDYFLYTLYCLGYVAIIKTDKFGVIPQGCSLRGYDVFYRPTEAVISNPLLRGIITPKIGTQCTLVKLQPDYGGIMDLVTYYADMMALCAQTAGVNLVNSKLSYVFTATNKAASQSFKRLYDKIASGEPMVIQDKGLLNPDGSPSWLAFQQNVGQNYIAGTLLEDLRKLEQRFDTVIGIPNANTEKKERLISDEVNSNNAETASLCSLWLEELQNCVEKANEMFSINVSVDWRVNPMEGGVDVGGNTETVKRS